MGKGAPEKGNPFPLEFHFLLVVICQLFQFERKLLAAPYLFLILFEGQAQLS